MLSTADVARIVGVSVDTLEKWRAAGDGPRWYRFGSWRRLGRERVRTVPRYRSSDVEAWIESKRVDTSDQPVTAGVAGEGP